MRMWVVKRSALIRWTIVSALVVVLIVIGVVACTGSEGEPIDNVEPIDDVMNYEVEALASATRERPIYSVGTQDKLVALSFDAGFEDDKTGIVLDILEAENVRSTFFLCGFWIDKHPEHVQSIIDKGHELGNHTDTHPHMTKISADKMLEEVRSVDDKLFALTDKRYPLFRAPYGEYSNDVIKTMRDAGFVTIQWSIDSLDWKPERTADQIVAECMQKLSPGAIILCHNNGYKIEEYLPKLIQEIKAAGYTFAPISELLHSGVTKIDASGVQWPAS